MNLNTETIAAEMDAAHAPYSMPAECYRNRAMCADERHVYTIFDVLMTGAFRHAVELGAYDGATTTAFIRALNLSMIETARICEIAPTDVLIAVSCSRHYGSWFQIDKRKSWDVLASSAPADFIFVDANHDLESVSKELDQILRRVPLCVMAHDTNATRMGYPAAEGAAHLADTLRKHPAYRGKCIEDAVRRQGEETHRGLFFATTNQDLYEKARAIFNARCPILEGSSI